MHAEIQSKQTEQDTAMLQLHLEDGLMVDSFFSMSSVDEDRFEFYGKAGNLLLDRHHSWNVSVTGPGLRQHKPSWYDRLQAFVSSPYLMGKILAPQNQPCYRAALSAFINSVRTNQQIHPDLEDGYRALKIIEAAEESARPERRFPW